MSEQANNDKAIREFSIVKFDKEYNKEGCMLLELVPSIWLINTENKWKCKWLLDDSFDALRKATKNQTPADEQWLTYNVEVISTART